MRDNYTPPIEITATKGDIWDEQYTVNRDGIHGKTYVPVCLFGDVEDRVLQENWNIRDIRIDSIFRTFLELNFDIYDKFVKVMYSNNKYEWINIHDWKSNQKYADTWIHKLKVAPYFYVDDYKREMIAGQLKYMELRIEKPLEEDRITKALSSPLSVPDVVVLRHL